MNHLAYWFERYGLLIVLLNCFALLPPDLSIKASMIGTDLELAGDRRSGGSLIKQLSWLIPLLLYGLYLLRDGINFQVTKNTQLLLVAGATLITLCLLSTIWSESSSHTIKRSIFQAILFLVISLSIYFSAQNETIGDCINWLFYIFIFICFFTIISGIGYRGALLGWANTKNNFGAYILALMSLLYLSRHYYHDKIKLYWPKMCLLFILIVATTSKTSMALAVIILVCTQLNIYLARLLLFTLTATLIILFLGFPAVSEIFDSFWNIGLRMEPSALTGRGLIWDTLYYDLQTNQRLFYGYGYGAYFSTGIIPEILDDAWSFMRFLNSAHNGFLEILLQFGAPLSILITYILYKLVSATKNPSCYLIAIIIFIHNITESSLMRDQHVMWVLLVFIICFGTLVKANDTTEDET